MKKNLFKRGFTLIELLVVIAIIGILASVVLASLNSARDKGEDAAIKSNLNNARAQAEMSYDDSDRSYDNVCSSTSTDDPQGIQDLYEAAGGTCTDDEDEWAASAELNDGSFYCVDYTGQATTTGSGHGTADNSINCN